MSLREFIDQGLRIYLDNKRIKIYDPLPKERIYEHPFWTIKLKSIKGKDERKEECKTRALMSEKITDKGYNTRIKNKLKSENVSQLSKEKIREIESTTVKTSDFVSTGNNRKVHNVDFNVNQAEFEEVNVSSDENTDKIEVSKAMQ